MSWKDDEEGPWGHSGDDNKSNPWTRKPNRGGKEGADIEELFKKSQDQFKTFFRKNGKGGGGRTL